MEARYAGNCGGGACQPSLAANADTEVPMSIDELKETRSCYQCQKLGHLKRNCPDAGRATQPRGGGTRGRGGRGGHGGRGNRTVECHRCCRQGHIAKDCQASMAEVNQAKTARAARATHQTSINKLASAEATSEAGAVAQLRSIHMYRS